MGTIQVPSAAALAACQLPLLLAKYLSCQNEFLSFKHQTLSNRQSLERKGKKSPFIILNNILIFYNEGKNLDRTPLKYHLKNKKLELQIGKTKLNRLAINKKIFHQIKYKCLCCRHLQEINKFKIGDKIHSTDRGGTCGSEDLIYAMECTKCSIWYIGETGDSLRGRLNGHRSVTKKIINGGSVDESKNDCGAPLHFGQKDHDFERDMRLYILDQGKWGSMRERCLKESYYIAKYKTLSPHGMNKYAGPLTDFYEIV